MTVSIPFAFGVGDQTPPSGKYIVLTDTPERSIRVVNSDGKQSAVVNTLPNYAAQAASENSRLVFHKYGPEYFLVESRRPARTWHAIRCPASVRWTLPAELPRGKPATCGRDVLGWQVRQLSYYGPELHTSK